MKKSFWKQLLGSESLIDEAKAYSLRMLDAGLEILAAVRERFGLPLLTDVHRESDVAPAAAVVDVIQIPAFLCRQTDLLTAASATGKPINLKKGQFVSPWPPPFSPV